MKLGIIGSSGGSALIAAVECLKTSGLPIELVIVTDRACGMEAWAKSKEIAHKRIEYSNAEQFSKDALSYFQESGCLSVLMFYTRKVTYPLISRIDIWNIHPALLPSFRGLHGVKDATEAGVRIFGATLHKVDDGLDTGPIKAQVASAIGGETLPAQAQRLSYLHKILLFLIWYEILSDTYATAKIYGWSPGDILASPGIASSILDRHFREFLENTPTA
ncbi:formyltransferase family protein [Agrobacterium sp. CG674]